MFKKVCFALFAAVFGFVACDKEKDDQTISTYRVLMVFVTEINVTAQSVGSDSGEITVDYKMSNYEREMLTTFSSKMSDWLNDALKDVVKIEVDHYFTTAKFTNRDFTSVYWPTMDDIPEISRIVADYHSVIVTLYATEKDGERTLMSYGGFSNGKSSTVYLEFFYGFAYQPGMYPNKSNLIDGNGNLTSLGFTTVMNLMDKELVVGSSGIIPWFMNVMNVYVHELTHSVELQSGAGEVYPFHDAMAAVSKFKPQSDMLLPVKLYLRGEAFTIEEGPQGRKVGIPRSYWKVL